MKTPELLLVLGGKHLGKTFLKGEAIKRCKETESNIDIVSVDMRDGDMSGKPLMAALDLQRRKSLKWSTRAMEVLGAVIRPLSQGREYSGAGEAAKGVLDVVVQAKQINIDNFINKTIRSGRIPSLIVDEANMALPGLDSVPNAAAKSALAAITKWTKQTNLASVMLISSDFGYPFLLLANGLDLNTISKVIVIGEVPEVSMLKMLKDDWGMDADLAEMFYNYFGGDIFTTKKALDSLMEKKDNFDPFAVVRCPGLPSCVKNAAARAHLENIAKQGSSFVEDVKTDEGARMIAEENLGGIIDKDAITFGLPAIFTGTDKKWAVIPSTYHMKLLIAHELQNIPLPTSGRCFANWLICFFVVLFCKRRTLFQRGGWMEVVDIYIYIIQYIYIHIFIYIYR
eukprot:Skav236604  [mRNA]  locus=scaffold3534:150120:151313:- [translate_table: standard]